MKAIPHIAWGIVAIAIGFGVYLYGQEKARNAVLEYELKAAQDSIKDRNDKTESTVKQMQQSAAKIKTPAQAVEAMPTVANLPLRIQTIGSLPSVTVMPDAPSSIKNAAVIPEESVKPLYDRLEKCAEDEVKFGACQENAKDYEKQIAALKKTKGGFWRRVKDCGIRVGVGAGSGGAFGGQKGVAFGAALGGVTCFVAR